MGGLSISSFIHDSDDLKLREIQTLRKFIGIVAEPRWDVWFVEILRVCEGVKIIAAELGM